MPPEPTRVTAASREDEQPTYDDWQEHAVDPRTDRVSDPYRKGDVLGAGSVQTRDEPRLWLILAAQNLPYPGEEYVCAALTTSDLPANYEVGDEWETGQNPDKTSYCSPWVVGTIKHRAVANPQGRISREFTDRMVEQCRTFLIDGE